MSDTMDRLSDTLGALMKKAKEIGAQAVETVDKTLELNGENDELRKIYTEIGKLYFEQTGGSAEGFFAPLFAQAGATAEKIRSLEEEIRSLRDSVMPDGAEKDIEVEIGAFDDIVSADEDAARGE